MDKEVIENDFFGKEKISKILLKIAPPVMLAQLIQALYNVADSFYVGQYSGDALNALTVIYPLQLVITALAVGMGVGVNTFMARKLALGKNAEADKTAGTGMILSLLMWIAFSIISVLIMNPYVATSAKSEAVISEALIYGRIVCIGSIGLFLEGNWSKVHQSYGNMKLPMIAQIIGAVINIVLDPILIFGVGPIQPMGVAGAAYATIIAQITAAVIVGIKGYRKPPKIKEMLLYAKKIYYYGYPSILMQGLYTVYIVALNVILVGFSDDAVTVLGIYYKVQTFFFIPMFGLETCMVPVISYNYARERYDRCHETMKQSCIITALFLVAATIVFIVLPEQIIGIFSHSENVLAIGRIALPRIGFSFLPGVISLLSPVFFQAIGSGVKSLLLSLVRQVFCLIPIFWLMSLIGLDYTWFAFPISESITTVVAIIMYATTFKKLKERKKLGQEKEEQR